MPGVGAPERHAVSGFDSQRDHGAGGCRTSLATRHSWNRWSSVIRASWAPSSRAIRSSTSGWSRVLSSDTPLGFPAHVLRAVGKTA